MRFLRIFFIIVLITMLAVTSWASMQCAVWQIPDSVLKHPWFTATLCDAYFGFTTFYAWVFYKESSVASRIVWFVLIMLLGNIAMASYMLIQLTKLKSGSGMRDLLLK